MCSYKVARRSDDFKAGGDLDIIEYVPWQSMEAIGKAAAQAANGKVVELWDGTRLIVRLPKDET